MTTQTPHRHAKDNEYDTIKPIPILRYGELTTALNFHVKWNAKAGLPYMPPTNLSSISRASSPLRTL
jgi:hypothetical protein